MSFIPISIEQYIKIIKEKNPAENIKTLRIRLEAALDDYNKGKKCQCGNDIWVVGSAHKNTGCFSCLTGKTHPAGDYEIDNAINKIDKYGRRHIDEMDPSAICGFFDDDGYEINADLIKKPDLCLTCLRNYNPELEDEILCNLNRIDQKDNDNFKCDEYIKI
jgi:hypothetical protein